MMENSQLIGLFHSIYKTNKLSGMITNIVYGDVEQLRSVAIKQVEDATNVHFVNDGKQQ